MPIQEGARLLLEGVETMLRQSDKQQAHTILDHFQKIKNQWISQQTTG